MVVHSQRERVEEEESEEMIYEKEPDKEFIVLPR